MCGKKQCAAQFSERRKHITWTGLQAGARKEKRKEFGAQKIRRLARQIVETHARRVRCAQHIPWMYGDQLRHEQSLETTNTSRSMNVVLYYDVWFIFELHGSTMVCGGGGRISLRLRVTSISMRRFRVNTSGAYDCMYVKGQFMLHTSTRNNCVYCDGRTTKFLVVSVELPTGERTCIGGPAGGYGHKLKNDP